MSKILNSKEIGWKVRTMRLRAGFTQERLAEALGITSQQVQKYESGTNRLNTDRLQQLAIIFNSPIQSFFVPIPAKPTKRTDVKATAVPL